MPQDSLRSVVYRLFVTCDDPKGVIEGKKSKIGPQNIKDHKIEKQRDSEYITKMRKRELDATGIGRTKSESVFADHRYNNKVVEFEKRRLPGDGSRDCYDELREVIRDSLARQNLLPPCCASEKARFDRRKVDLYQDFPSTTSSESSIEEVCVAGRKLVMSPEFLFSSSSQYASSVNCSPARIQKEKPKVPNLIARLMGLEEIPPTLLHQKQSEKDKIFKQRRPIFEIDFPKATKLPIISQKAVPRRRTLEGIIETMQFKGLLRSKSSEGCNNVISHQSGVSHFLKSSADGVPPIVIMKPVYAPELQAERFSTSIYDENPQDTKDSFGKWKLKEENSPVNFTIYRKLQTRNVQKTSCIPDKGSKDHSEAPAGHKTNDVVIQGKLPSSKNIASSPGRTKQPKKEAIEKKVERTKRAPGAKNYGEVRNANLNDTAKFQDQSKRTTAKVRKPEKKSKAPEKLVAPQNSGISKRITAIASHNFRNRKNNVKIDKSFKSSSVVPMIENMEHKDDNIQIVHSVVRDSDITIAKVTSTEELPCEKVTEVLENVAIAESTLPLIQCDHDIPLMEHTRYQIHLDSAEKENFKSRDITRHILLSSESFLSRAEELFDTDAWEPTLWQTIGIDNGMSNSTPFDMSRVSVSFDKLVNETCDTKVDGSNLSVDTLYALHERDIWCNGMDSTTWDLGWRNVFSLDEVEQVVTDIEKHVLNGIIDNVLTEFTLL